MNRPEVISRILISAVVLAVVAGTLLLWRRTHLVHARMSEAGGWAPSVLQAAVGRPLHLRLTSDDVTHGFAVGQMDMQSVDVEPGRVTDINLIFDKPGTYTFYCTRWCGVNHWRMRGTIEVSGNEPARQTTDVPLYVKLGLNLDAVHDSPITPQSRPSAMLGEQLAASTDLSGMMTEDYYRAHSPYEVWRQLRGTSTLADRTDDQIWDIVAFIWQSNTSPDALVEGQSLFAQNCAACHGPAGAGDGVFASRLASAGTAGGANGMIQRPANLADPRRMLGASPALLQGKILRGGMGTGMPSWGPIFEERQVWNIVSYLYTIQFQEITK